MLSSTDTNQTTMSAPPFFAAASGYMTNNNLTNLNLVYDDSHVCFSNEQHEALLHDTSDMISYFVWIGMEQRKPITHMDMDTGVYLKVLRLSQYGYIINIKFYK
jgi:hypothetical protein